MFYTICGQQNKSPYPAKAIWAFNENDIWIAVDGDQIARVEKGVQTETSCLPASTSLSINKIWGRSSNDMYVVGDDGSIAHYNTGYWQKMESGTNIRLRDIYGTQDGKSIFVCGDDWNTGNSIILDISNFNKPKIILNNIFNQDVSLKEFSCLWTDGKQLILGGSRVYRRYLINDALNSDVVNTEQIPTDYGSREFLPDYFINSLRGTGLNNLFISGDHGMVWHFNGKSWFEYPQLFASNRRFWGSAVKENTVAFVGYSDRALIIIGKR